MKVKDSSIGFELYGDKELRKTFEDLKASQQRSILISTFRRAAKPMLNDMKMNLRSALKNKKRKNLLKSIGAKPVRNKIMLVLGARRQGNFKGRHGFIIDKGTASRQTKGGKHAAHSTGSGPATNFFTHAVESGSRQTEQEIYKHFEDSIEKFFYRRAAKSQNQKNTQK